MVRFAQKEYRQVCKQHWVTHEKLKCYLTALLYRRIVGGLYIVRLLLLFLLLIIRRIRRSRQPKRAFWVRPIYQRRVELGEYHNLIQEMRLQDNESFFRYFRMIPSQFDRLLDLVGPSIMYQDTRWRQCITAGQRLAITLR